MIKSLLISLTSLCIASVAYADSQTVTVHKSMQPHERSSHRPHAYQWVNMAGGRIPQNAINVNNDPVLYLCQAAYKEGMHPGEVTPMGCKITYGGSVIFQRHYRVFAGYGQVGWEGHEPFTFNGRTDTLRNAIEAGYEDGHLLYACRTKEFGEVHLGKIVAGRCNIAVGDREDAKTFYQVLVRQ